MNTKCVHKNTFSVQTARLALSRGRSGSGESAIPFPDGVPIYLAMITRFAALFALLALLARPAFAEVTEIPAPASPVTGSVRFVIYPAKFERGYKAADYAVQVLRERGEGTFATKIAIRAGSGLPIEVAANSREDVERSKLIRAYVSDHLQGFEVAGAGGARDRQLPIEIHRFSAIAEADVSAVREAVESYEKERTSAKSDAQRVIRVMPVDTHGDDIGEELRVLLQIK
jgi:hypothetical protein